MQFSTISIRFFALLFSCFCTFQIAYAQTTLIPLNSDWSYLDDGVDQTGNDWNTLGFNADSWSSGAALLGYGDADITTVLNFGGDVTNKRTTYYFRHIFNLTQVDCIAGLNINILRDDGAIIYLNGQEVFRTNMPAGVVNASTFASGPIGGNGELTYHEIQLSGAQLVDGDNLVAVEVHQHSLGSSDIRFDLGMTTIPLVATDHISNFTSLASASQTPNFILPTTHTFQYIVETGDPLIAGGTMPINTDFAGYVPINGCSTEGYLSVNSEAIPGGVSIFDINYFAPAKRWQVTASEAVDFSSVGGTSRNCSGAVTSWGTIISCEESIGGGANNNGDSYRDLGWAVEIDPATKTVLGKRWAMGNFEHENAVVHANERTVYQGRDVSTGFLYKFVADVARDLSSGKLYVYRGAKNGNGDWILLNNTTPAERNTTIQQSLDVNATIFNGIEDVEINPMDGKVYFAVKGSNEAAVYRFTDSDPLTGTTVSDMEIYVGGVSQSYTLNTENGVQTVAWGSGNDNLAFDDLGNLWVQQDGGNDHIWVVEDGHTQVSPKVKIFGRSPTGSEPTGITFSPDFRFMFMSIQHPSSSNNANLPDAFGIERDFNKDVTLVVARRELLGTGMNDCPENLAITEGLPPGQQSYQVQNALSTIGTISIENQASVILQAGQSITLNAGFNVTAGNEFTATIGDCTTPPSFLPDIDFRNTAPPLSATADKSESNFQIFPNPAQDQLQIKPLHSQISLSQIELFDIHGRTVMHQKVSQRLRTDDYSLELSKLSSGSYFLKLWTTDGRFEVQKVIVMK
ncbi:MAG: alkaline phosphatase PhoX [Saprospiraceae bacterium]